LAASAIGGSPVVGCGYPRLFVLSRNSIRYVADAFSLRR
jgi:hypothetical protein